MRILLISNQHPNKQGIGNPVMCRMKNALSEDSRIEKVEFLPFYNSLSSLKIIRKVSKQYDLVHIHFGGLYALIIWFLLIGVHCKKFITFHGTDIHAKALKTAKDWKERLKIRLNQKASFLSIKLFDKCGFVAKEMMTYVPSCLAKQMAGKAFIQVLGVDYSTFRIINKEMAQEYLGLEHKKYVLFSDVSNTSIKRRDIAENIVRELGPDYNLLIMCGVKPDEVPYYINACEFALLTSDEEGSPNIIREVLSLNKSFFSVEVGDAAKQLEGLHNSCIISRNPQEAARQICNVIINEYSDNTRLSLQYCLDFSKISRRVIDLYLS